MGCGSAKISQSSTKHAASGHDEDSAEVEWDSETGGQSQSHNEGSNNTNTGASTTTSIKRIISAESNFSTATTVSGTSRIRVTLSSDGSLLQIETEELEETAEEADLTIEELDGASGGCEPQPSCSYHHLPNLRQNSNHHPEVQFYAGNDIMPIGDTADLELGSPYAVRTILHSSSLQNLESDDDDDNDDDSDSEDDLSHTEDTMVSSGSVRHKVKVYSLVHTSSPPYSLHAEGTDHHLSTLVSDRQCKTPQSTTGTGDTASSSSSELANGTSLPPHPSPKPLLTVGCGEKTNTSFGPCQHKLRDGHYNLSEQEELSNLSNSQPSAPAKSRSITTDLAQNNVAPLFSRTRKVGIKPDSGPICNHMAASVGNHGIDNHISKKPRKPALDVKSQSLPRSHIRSRNPSKILSTLTKSVSLKEETISSFMNLGNGVLSAHANKNMSHKPVVTNPAKSRHKMVNSFDASKNVIPVHRSVSLDLSDPVVECNMPESTTGSSIVSSGSTVPSTLSTKDSFLIDDLELNGLYLHVHQDFFNGELHVLLVCLCSCEKIITIIHNMHNVTLPMTSRLHTHQQNTIKPIIYMYLHPFHKIFTLC